jgi:hypothetical protein
VASSVFPESLDRMQLQRRPTTVPARSELDHTSGWGIRTIQTLLVAEHLSLSSSRSRQSAAVQPAGRRQELLHWPHPLTLPLFSIHSDEPSEKMAPLIGTEARSSGAEEMQ